MPLPLKDDVFIPDNFDPDKYCGAGTRRRNKDGLRIVCMSAAGFGTDHVGLGRCKFHGGATPTIHGRASKVQRQSIMERVEAMERDPQLLALDKQLAVLRVQFEMQLKQFAAKGEAYEELMEVIEETLTMGGSDAPIEIPEEMIPKIDLATVEMMIKLSRNIFEMRFSKRFSMPITQVQSILMSLMEEFARICLKWQVPNEARMEFAKAIRSIRAVGAATNEDRQLAIAGGESEADYFEGVAREAS